MYGTFVVSIVSLILLVLYLSFQIVKDSVEQFIERDPAASSKLIVFLTYPGVHALLLHRISHFLTNHHSKFLAHIVAYVSRVITSIEIHPQATIGRGLMIDHGSGVVIGATAIIHNNVTIYSSVVLGGRAPSKAEVHSKRHPTLCDDATIGCGSTVLGNIRIGVGSKVGSNSVVLQDVPDYQTVVGIPARQVITKASKKSPASSEKRFQPYGMPSSGATFPMCFAIKTLVRHLHRLEQKVGKPCSNHNDSGEDDSLDQIMALIYCNCAEKSNYPEYSI
ncbi:hypothetical protein P9112_000239 [Eukaryota sp. TZLM1-RC]